MLADRLNGGELRKNFDSSSVNDNVMPSDQPYDLQDEKTGEIIFYLKGADVVMSKIVAHNDWMEEECGNMAREGLRTLVVARKVLTSDQYDEFDVGVRVLDWQHSFSSFITIDFFFFLDANRKGQMCFRRS